MYPSFLFAAAATAAADDWLSLRRDMALTIWPDGGGGLPGGDTPVASVPRARGFSDLTELTWTIGCPNFTLDSTVYHSVRQIGKHSDTVIIHHHGHAHACDTTLPESRCDSNRSFYDFYNVTDYYHRELGADAFFLYMPLFGPNRQRGLPESHSWFEQWQARGVPTIKFYLEPVVLTINLALSKLGYKRVLMIGKSGGGWTTTLAAALDPRIALSFPIAGSVRGPRMHACVCIAGSERGRRI